VLSKAPEPTGDLDADGWFTGLKRELRAVRSPMLPLPRSWGPKIVQYCLTAPDVATGAVRMRDACEFIAHYCGQRRNSEVDCRKHSDMGLREGHVTIEYDQVGYYVHRMKNDPFGKGQWMWLAQVTMTGIPITAIFREHIANLDAFAATDADLPLRKDRPFFQGWNTARQQWSGTAFTGWRKRFKIVLKAAIGLSDALARRYNLHSLRRGATTTALRTLGRQGLRAVRACGVWATEQSMDQYHFLGRQDLAAVSATL
jgi:hypothetical protein